jgi:hypothetical protein
MCTRVNASAAGAAVLACALAAPAFAQVRPESSIWTRLSFDVAASATLSPPDPGAFFSYTDYERDETRLARVRLLTDWRLRHDLAFVAEVRTANVDGLEGAAWYLRWQPFGRRDLTVQAGRIPPLVGAFPRRAYDRQNVVVGSPLAYQYLTSLRPDALPATTDDILRMRGRGWQPFYPIGSAASGPGIPLVSASRWDTGVEAHWTRGILEFAGALTLGSPAVPVIRETNDGRAYAARVAVAVPAGPTIGASAGAGAWVDRKATAALPPGAGDDGGQRIAAIDAEYGTGRWLFRAEALRSRFEVPVASNRTAAVLHAWSSFGEARYRWHPRWQIGGRVEQLGFSRLQSASTGAWTTWDAPVRRVEIAVASRLTRTLEVRVGWQQNWRDGGRLTRRGVPIVAVLYGR